MHSVKQKEYNINNVNVYNVRWWLLVMRPVEWNEKCGPHWRYILTVTILLSVWDLSVITVGPWGHQSSTITIKLTVTETQVTLTVMWIMPHLFHCRDWSQTLATNDLCFWCCPCIQVKVAQTVLVLLMQSHASSVKITQTLLYVCMYTKITTRSSLVSDLRCWSFITWTVTFQYDGPRTNFPALNDTTTWRRDRLTRLFKSSQGDWRLALKLVVDTSNIQNDNAIMILPLINITVLLKRHYWITVL